MNEITSYPKIYAIGKAEINNIFASSVEITEKIDGSMFAFGLNKDGDFVLRSKGAHIYFEAYPKMFDKAIEYLQSHSDLIKSVLKPSTYIYGEYLQKEKHNVLAYQRVPKNHIMIFAVKEGLNFIDDYKQIAEYANKLDLECVPLLYSGSIDLTRIEDALGGYTYAGYDLLKRLINTTQSVLGGTIIEGIVAKNYRQHTTIGDPTICCGKYVRESFKEQHRTSWKTNANSLEEFIESFKTEARWQKAVQHLRELGQLEDSLRDIGKLIQEVHRDIAEEEKETISRWLYRHFIQQILRKSTGGLPEFYKDKLLKKAFDGGSETQS